MLGFLGTFSVNFEIPDYRGTGKHVVSDVNLLVSRGFGTVVKQRTEDRSEMSDNKDRGRMTEDRRQNAEA